MMSRDATRNTHHHLLPLPLRAQFPRLWKENNRTYLMALYWVESRFEINYHFLLLIITTHHWYKITFIWKKPSFKKGDLTCTSHARQQWQNQALDQKFFIQKMELFISFRTITDNSPEGAGMSFWFDLRLVFTPIIFQPHSSMQWKVY